MDKIPDRTSTPSASLESDLLRSRVLTDHLFAQVLPDALYERPIPERHRLVFYIGHLEAFDWNILGRRALGLGPVVEELDSLFAFGIDPPEGEIPRDEPGDWPALDEMRRYVAETRRKLNACFHDTPERASRMVIEHRLMHAETLTYLIHNLPPTQRRTRTFSIHAAAESPPLQFIHIPAGFATLGADPKEGFCWDNEMEIHRRPVDAFTIARHKVTNGQYLAFLREGGSAPHYWTERNGQWLYRGFHGEAPLPLAFPVYVTWLQAQAYAQWMGKALPTEEQFHRAAFGTPFGTESLYAWGNAPPQIRQGSFDFRHVDPVAVTASPDCDSAFGVSQLVGNGWEWTSSVFSPFPGFQPDPLYPEYSANFFDDGHRTVKGASPVTDHVLMRRSFRNWFRHHYRYAYTTFRLVEN
jgi:formylglycine-generating enzyme required for sulfatase activity